MTRALVAAILIFYQVLVWTCPVFCRGALQHEAIVVTEQRSVSGHEHHSQSHGADAPADALSVAPVHKGCENCGTAPTSVLSVAPKIADANTVIIFINFASAPGHPLSDAAVDRPLRVRIPDTSPPGRTLSPLRV